MEFLSASWWSALLAIILIDLVLAGDNAIVIALAARNLPSDLQKKAIVWGTVGAIAVRSVMTLCVVWLLQIPGLMLVGAARAITMALSPASTRSIRMMASRADHQEADRNSMNGFLRKVFQTREAFVRTSAPAQALDANPRQSPTGIRRRSCSAREMPGPTYRKPCGLRLDGVPMTGQCLPEGATPLQKAITTRTSNPHASRGYRRPATAMIAVLQHTPWPESTSPTSKPPSTIGVPRTPRLTG
jgi:hypothetical protein